MKKLISTYFAISIATTGIIASNYPLLSYYRTTSSVTPECIDAITSSICVAGTTVKCRYKPDPFTTYYVCVKEDGLCQFFLTDPDFK